MSRLRVERIKAIVFTALTLITLLAMMAVQSPSLAWIPVVLGAASAWFWWKVDYLSKQGED